MRSRKLLQQVSYAGQVAANSLSGYFLYKVLASIFGISETASAFDIAFSFPFFIMSLSGFSFLHGIISTQVARLRLADPVAEHVFISSVLNLAVLIALAICGIAFFNLSPLVQVLAPGLSDEGKGMLKTLLLLTMPLTITLGIGNLFGAVFTAHEIPVTGELPLCISRILAGAIIICVPGYGSVEALAWWLLLGSCLGLLVHLVLIRRHIGPFYTARIHFNRELGEFCKLSIGLFIASIIATLNAVYMKRLATLSGVEIVAAISFALSIVGPIVLVVGKFFNYRNVAVHMRHIVARDYQAGRQNLLREIVYTVFSMLLTSFLLSFFLEDIIRLLFKGGAFDQHASAMVASFSYPLIWSLMPSVLLWTVLTPMLAGSKRHFGGLMYSIGWLCQIGLNYLLFPSLGARILVVSYTLGIYIQAALALWLIWYSLPGKEHEA